MKKLLERKSNILQDLIGTYKVVRLVKARRSGMGPDKLALESFLDQQHFKAIMITVIHIDKR
jgi:hypothetical protein